MLQILPMPTRRVNKATGNAIFNFGYVASDPNFNNEFVAFRVMQLILLSL
jgi:hypothetical protein